MFWLLLISVVVLTSIMLSVSRWGEKMLSLSVASFTISTFCFVITSVISAGYCVCAVNIIYQGHVAEKQIVYVENQLNELDVIYSDVIGVYIEREERIYSDVGTGKIAYSQPGMKTVESLGKYIEMQQEMRNKMIDLNETITKAKFVRFLTFLF